MWLSNTFHHDLNAAKPPVLASACLLGEALRYDGRDKYQPAITRWIKPHCQLIPLCPEVGAGLAVPRPAMRIVQTPTTQELRARGVDTDIDITEQLLDFSRQQLEELSEQLCGAILTSRSPSCGIGSTPIYAADSDTLITTENGLFAAHCQDSRPWLVMYDESGLQTTRNCLVFLWRVLANYDVLTASSPAQAQKVIAHHADLISTFDSSIKIPPVQHDKKPALLCQWLQSLFNRFDRNKQSAFVMAQIKAPLDNYL